MSWISIDVELDDIYREMGRSDKRKMTEWLDEDGYLDDYKDNEENAEGLIPKNSETYDESKLRGNLNRIWNGSMRLSAEDEEIIRTIANKL